jgi:outer membrane protein assembly factor BamB
MVGSPGDHARIVKVSGRSGRVRWRYASREHTKQSTSYFWALAADPAGDVVVAGEASVGGDTDFTVVKLRSSDGKPRWRYDLQSTEYANTAAYAVAVDAQGDVFAGGTYDATGRDPGLGVVVKLAAASGSELWRWSAPPTAVRALAADPSGNVFVSADERSDLGEIVSSVRKLSGRDGHQIWSVPANDILAVDAAGNVVVTRGSGVAPTVAQLLADTGAVRWEAAFPDGASGAPVSWSSGAEDANGDVLLGGDRDDDWVVVKLDGTSGALRWTQTVDGSAHQFDDLTMIAVDGGGDVVAVGTIGDVGTCGDFGVALLDGSTGRLEHLHRLDGDAIVSPCSRPDFDDGAEIDGDQGLAVTLDRSGAVVAAGLLFDGQRHARRLRPVVARFEPSDAP